MNSGAYFIPNIERIITEFSLFKYKIKKGISKFHIAILIYLHKMQNEKKSKEEYKDLGFGTKVYSQNRRFINPDGSFNVKREGLPYFSTLNFYHTLISMSWLRFIILILITYLLANIVFAIVYLLVGIENLTNIDGTTPFHKFMEAFFFSAQTITTVGYGRVAPISIPAGAVAAIESMIGLLGFALATGLLYGRFSRPVAKIIFSKNAILAPYRDGKGLMFRVANERKSQLIESEVQVTLTMLDESKQKVLFETLNLERSKINYLALSWTIVHPIDDSSPLKNLTQKDIEERDVEILILLKAFDETFSQTVYARSSYKYNEIEWGAKFASIIKGSDDKTTLQLDKINDFVKADIS
jgi:inward rectifier potassium channel